MLHIRVLKNIHIYVVTQQMDTDKIFCITYSYSGRVAQSV